MKLILGITDRPKQQSTILLDDGSAIVLSLRYAANQMGWFYDLTWGDFILNGMRLVASPNFLRQFRNQIPFGMALFTDNGLEPIDQDCFPAETASLYLLQGDDLTATESALFPGL